MADFGVDSRVEILLQEIVKLHREAYYTLRRGQANQVAAKRAREESTAKLGSERAAYESERAAWQSEREALLVRQSQLVAKEQLAAKKEQAAAEKEKEMGEVGEMMQSLLELQMEAEAELKVRKEQVYKLRAELSDLRARTRPPA